MSRLRFTLVAEYDANFEHYGLETDDPAAMAAIDQESLDSGVFDVGDLLNAAEVESLTVEPAGVVAPKEGAE